MIRIGASSALAIDALKDLKASELIGKKIVCVVSEEILILNDYLMLKNGPKEDGSKNTVISDCPKGQEH